MHIKKTRSRRYPAVTTIEQNYGDDRVLHANISAQAEYLLHSLAQAVGDIALNGSAAKKFLWSKQGDIFTISWKPPELVEPFTYLDDSITSTEIDINIRVA